MVESKMATIAIRSQIYCASMSENKLNCFLKKVSCFSHRVQNIFLLICPTTIKEIQ